MPILRKSYAKIILKNNTISGASLVHVVVSLLQSSNRDLHFYPGHRAQKTCAQPGLVNVMVLQALTMKIFIGIVKFRTIAVGIELIIFRASDITKTQLCQLQEL